MTWTEFWDMHSGGDAKEPWHYIYIEAPEGEARRIFYNRFGHNPDNVTCSCCGEDYTVHESETLEAATQYHRHDYEEVVEEAAEDPDNELGRSERPKRISVEEFFTPKEPITHEDGYIETNWDSAIAIYEAEIKPEERR